jgi:cob(I)alamin adenosyltransferase
MDEKLSRGLVHVYTGNGKGKTTAALGLALRASGQNMKVIFIQYIKGIPAGEHAFVARYHPFEIVQPGIGDCFNKSREQLLEDAQKTLGYSMQMITSEKYNIVILDEIFVAIDQKLISLKEAMSLMDKKPESVELVMTGRNAPPEIVQRADLVTEMLMIKHPFTIGITGRRGIEY